MNKAIFLDRDGTINRDDKGFTHKVEDFKFHDGVIEGLKQLKDYKLFVITNQPGISKGIYTEEDLRKFNDHMLGELSKEGIHIEEIYHCPHTREEGCDCIKPNTKFIEQAKSKHNIDISRSWVIGDHGSDVQMGKNSGCKAIYLLTGHGQKHLDQGDKVEADHIAPDFLDAVRFILKEV